MSAAPPRSYAPPDKRQHPPQRRVAGQPTSTGQRGTKQDSIIATAAALITAHDVERWITRLSEFPTRHTRSPHNAAAAQWLKAECEALGYADVTLHDFPIDGVQRSNVVCTKPGGSEPSRYVVVGAHYDSRAADLDDPSAAAPGADDNASGVAAMLGVARALASVDTHAAVRFIGFSGEEQGLVGSSAYAAFAADAGLDIPLMINLDMVGHPVDLAQRTIIIEQDLGNAVLTNDAASQATAARMVQDAADHTSLSTMLGPIYSSDYMPFEAAGYVCVGAFDGADSEPFYHSSHDTLDKVDVGFCVQVARLVTATVLTAAGFAS
jgi:Peptidase family M28